MKQLLMGLCAVLLMAGVAWGQACTPHSAKVNVQGTGGAAITVTGTATTIAAANRSRCSILIDNVSSNDMRCRSAGDGDPTSTVGKLIPAGRNIAMGTEGQEEWKCIRTGGSNATAEVIEGFPKLP